MELEVLSNVAGCFRNTHDFFKGRIPQVAEFGELCRKAAHQRVAWLDEVLADSAFIAGDRFTIADITAVVGIDFGRLIDLRVLPEQKNLTRWHEAVSARPAASA